MNLKSKTLLYLINLLIIAGFITQPIWAATNAELEKRIKKLEKQVEEKDSSGLGKISDAITLFGTIELDYSYAEDSDVSDNTVNSSTSDLDVGTVELGIEAQLHDYVTATVLLKAEALDSDSNVFWDEVFFEIKKPDFPLYLVAGKRCQPFGVFESNFINDPVTQDVYEINDTGLTVGLSNKEMAGIDVSVTIYKGNTLITKVNDAGYGWSRPTGAAVTDDVDSFIVSGSIAPIEALSLSAFYNSEPGDSDRNTTAGAAARLEIGAFSLDAEYIGALERELNGGQEYKENAWTIALGFQIIDPLLIALRYESFDADQAADGNLENRYGAAITYTLFENDSFACNLMGEVRHSEYETVGSSSYDDDVDEIFARIAIEF